MAKAADSGTMTSAKKASTNSVKAFERIIMDSSDLSTTDEEDEEDEEEANKSKDLAGDVDEEDDESNEETEDDENNRSFFNKEGPTEMFAEKCKIRSSYPKACL